MYFLQFRLQVVTSRLEHELESLKKRIHILEGFEKVFDALDEIIRIIRKSEGKADSAEKIIKRFGLDAEQADAILELKLYRLARLEILVIQNELADKRKRARQINSLLKDEEGRWKVVRDEIEEIQRTYGGKEDKRRTLIESEEEVSFTADDFIVEEDNVVIVSRDGWVKRQKEVRDLSTTRLREGDSVLAVVQGSTRAAAVFFSNFGAAYSSRIIDVPASTGYGEPVQKLFKLRDGERIVAAFSLDQRSIGDIATRKEGEPPPVHAIAVTSDGYSLGLVSNRSLNRAPAQDGGMHGQVRASRSSASRARRARRSSSRRRLTHARFSAAPTKSITCRDPARASSSSS
jgi:DNA gyrase subunit A